MKHSILLIAVLITCLQSHSGQDRGGGDPDAIRYSQILDKLPNIVFKNSQLRTLISPEDIRQYAKLVSDSLNDKDTSNDLVEFTSTPIEVDGIEKVAKFESGTGIVTVYRKEWAYYEEKRLRKKMQALVLLETLLALEVYVGRYKIVGDTVYSDRENVSKLQNESGQYFKDIEHETCNNRHVIKKKGRQPVKYNTFESTMAISWLVGTKFYTANLYLPESDQGANARHGLFDLIQMDYESDNEAIKGVARRRRFYLDRYNKVREKKYKKKFSLNKGDRKSERLKASSTDVDRSQKTESHSETTYKNGFLIKTSHSKKYKTNKKGKILTTVEIQSTCTTQPLDKNWEDRFNNKKLLSGIKTFNAVVKQYEILSSVYEDCVLEKHIDDCIPAKEKLEGMRKVIQKSWGAVYKVSKSRKKSRFRKKHKSTENENYNRRRSRTVDEILDRIDRPLKCLRNRNRTLCR